MFCLPFPRPPPERAWEMCCFKEQITERNVKKGPPIPAPPYVASIILH